MGERPRLYTLALSTREVGATETLFLNNLKNNRLWKNVYFWGCQHLARKHWKGVFPSPKGLLGLREFIPLQPVVSNKTASQYVVLG